MSKLGNLLTSLAYHLTQPIEFPFDFVPDWSYDFRTVTRSQIVNDLFPRKIGLDTTNQQLWRSSQVIGVCSSGVIIEAEPIAMECYDKVTGEGCRKCWNNQLVPCPPTMKRYTHASALLTTEHCYKFDMYSPGRMMVNCTMPAGGVLPSPWLLHLEPGKMFEVDLGEAFDCKRCRCIEIAGSIHEGPDYANKRIFSTTHIKGMWEPDHMHQLDVVWDGKGNFQWYLNGFMFKWYHMKLPEGLAPHLVLSLMVTRSFTGGPRTWVIQDVKYKRGK